MNVTFNGGTGRQAQWFTDAMARMDYNWDSVAADVSVSWPVEPSLPGHKEYACTIYPGGGHSEFRMEIRKSLDSDVSRNFYTETVAHELSHILAYLKLTPESSVAPMFYKVVSGDGKVSGTAADVFATDGRPWEDKLEEGIAETLKDTLLPEIYRDYDNRTNWQIDKTRYPDFMASFVANGDSLSPLADWTTTFTPIPGGS